jgi:hypothetical protein
VFDDIRKIVQLGTATPKGRHPCNSGKRDVAGSVVIAESEVGCCSGTCSRGGGGSPQLEWSSLDSV